MEGDFPTMRQNHVAGKGARHLQGMRRSDAAQRCEKKLDQGSHGCRHMKSHRRPCFKDRAEHSGLLGSSLLEDDENLNWLGEKAGDYAILSLLLD